MSPIPRQLNLPFRMRLKHGGRRAGAGRPKVSDLQSHIRRPELTRREPVHVTLKLQPGLPSLRRKELFRCLRRAVCTARKQGFGVTHFAILSNHIHMILEPRTSGVGRLFQSLCISFAKRLNKKLARKGAVFLDRYHLRVLKTPTEVRRALAYVLTNESRHQIRGKVRRLKNSSLEKFAVRLDPFSSAYRFEDWKSLLGSKVEFGFSAWSENLMENWFDEILTPARTWLLTRGWMLAKE